MGTVRRVALVGWLPALLAVLTTAEVATAYDDRGSAGQLTMLAFLLPLDGLLLARARYPGAVAVGATALVLAFVLTAQGELSDQPPLSPFLALLVAFFWLGLREHGRRLAASAGAAAVLVTGLHAAQVVAGRAVGDVVPATALWVGAFTAGWVAQRSLRQAREAGERARVAEASRELAARSAAEAERARIARELHDVLAHSLTAMVVQASVEARLPGDAQTTNRTLRQIERTGREALTELRRLLGLLREGEHPSSSPLPALAEVDRLVAELRRSGHHVVVDGKPPHDLGPGLDLSAYRVLQEAVTNVIKHAPGASVRLSVGEADQTLTLEVENGPPSRPVEGVPGGGHGLAGMRERVRIYGGSVDARPTSEGGFRLRVVLPLGDASPSEVA